MLSKKLLNALNEQFNYELESANIYLAMAGYTSDLGLGGFTNWFMAQYEEELFHAKKIMKFINDKNGRIEVKSVAAPQNDFGSLLEVFEKTLEHEQEVTTKFYELMDIALEEKEHATKSFLQWFIDEQVEEEANVCDMINKIKLVKDSGLYLLDQEAAQRTFKANSPI
ncbi:ferritin [Allofrancisella guangzhouensis]|uniref:Ferritin n=1 Tax=Allofrancisella guangzhouensis TaxID=594679 RepID=A0A0A8EAV1_9GAMM|nr:ferritin [Allofrancisella guangzhouensis]AJC49311.1 ferritin [Allofrancisella guangzhouensis]MBK2027210.1 ferritin [Allofrancisella guangzhouensis]MBK2044646.1 ferritin [Allofrancisella guangzhouensis]MBK2045071.1 ferritin [Allofrancisella guangzhouensis]